jgi:C_GCAxxG_C_C family probable redox protein
VPSSPAHSDVEPETERDIRRGAHVNMDDRHPASVPDVARGKVREDASRPFAGLETDMTHRITKFEMSDYDAAVERASALFEEGLNCAEAVLAAFAERRGVSASVVRLASPFGSGMGRTNQTCGAVTGALMALGLAAGRETAADATGKERAYALAAQFCERFRAENGALACTELLGIDLGTPSGRQAALDAGVFRTRCPALVRSAARIVTELA